MKTTFPSESWQFQFAVAAERRFVSIRSIRKPLDDKGRQKWAGVFDKINRIDGYDLTEIRNTMQWLFDGDDPFWRTNGCKSAASLRKTNDDGLTKFDQIYSRYQASLGTDTRRTSGIIAAIARQMA